MKNLPTFETFVNESVINEATAADKALVIAREFLDAVEKEFKVKAAESQMLKMTPKGFEVRVVIDDKGDKMYDFAKSYTDEHKDDVKGVPLQFKISPAISGRSTLWPSDNKKYFDIVEEAVESVNEDTATTLILMLQSAMVGGQLAMLANKVDFHPIDDLKDWWKEHKRDKAVQSIIDKLKDDQEVIQFLQMPLAKQRGQWKKLIEPKLSADEIKYINSVSRDRVKTGKI